MKKIIVENKNIVLFVIIGLLLILTITISFSWMNSNQNEVVMTSVDATSGHIDDITFSSGNELTFASDGVNFSGTTNPTVTLNKHPQKNEGDSTYNMFIDVSVNDFVYTTEERTAELILTITDPNGEIIDEAYGLNFVTVEGISGFDVTGFDESLLLVNDFPIYTTSTTIHTWDVTLTLVDLPTNQSENDNKTFTATIGMNGYEEEMLLNETLLAHNGGKDYIEGKLIPDFNVNSTINEGLHALEDDYGTSYYFRGKVDNNWIYFANMYWRIIRINGDDSIKILYQGKEKPSYGGRILSSYETIGTPSMYVLTNVESATGYMYTAGQNHGFTTDSASKVLIDTWYTTYLIDYSDYFSDTLFCNNRTIVTGPGFGSYLEESVATTFEDYKGVDNLKCKKIEDSFTVDDEVNGNGALTYPIAMLTAAEVYNAGNSGFIYNTGTITPRLIIKNSYPVYIYRVDNSTLSSYYINNALNPVVNLKANTLVSGKGTWDDPYVVQGLK